MEQLELRNLFDAIKKDDLKSFSSIMLSNSDLNICYGRFPILSLCYLYGSFAILEKYEKLLLPIHNFVYVDEYYEIYLKFKKHAQKSLKLFVYSDKIVYPIEMLAVLDERFLLNKYYKKLYKNEEIVENLQKIYRINKQIELSATMQTFEIETKELGFKQKFLVAAGAFVFALIITLSSICMILVDDKFGVGTAASPVRISTEQELQTALKKGKRCYVLENDIVLTKEFDSKDFKGSIDGAGFKLVAGEYLSDGFIDELSGSVKNLTIECEFKHKIISQNFGILAKLSSGQIVNCKIVGDLKFETYNDTDVYISVFVSENRGVISNCETESSVKIKNNRSSNAFFAYFAGVNNGKIENSKTIVGGVSADTVDIAGVACTNNGDIIACENNVSMKQVSEKEWHPNSAGVCITNNGKILGSKNYKEIYSESLLDVGQDGAVYYVFAGGIACENYGTIETCFNSGKLIGVGIISTVYAGGIVAMNYSTETTVGIVKKSLAECDIAASSQQKTVYAAGVVASSSSYYYSTLMGAVISKMSEIVNCGFDGEIETNAKNMFGAGIAAYNIYGYVGDCYARTRFDNQYEDGNDFLAGLISGTTTLQYLENNHYVIGDTFDTAVYSLQTFGSIINVNAVADNSSNSVPHALIDEIPQEVKLNVK